ncbi:hypothetical protein BGZ51_009446 [Haplosporangium sp. Z 767]|nr:hypothetical protein BGZ51_009446 [Haplosporangium sp. Z 767]
MDSADTTLYLNLFDGIFIAFVIDNFEETSSLPRFHVGNTGHTIPTLVKDEKQLWIHNSSRIYFNDHQMAGNGRCQGFDVRYQFCHGQGHIFGMDDLRIKLKKASDAPSSITSVIGVSVMAWYLEGGYAISYPSPIHPSIHPTIRRYMTCSGLIGQSLTGNQDKDKDKDKD